ncbi:hypothetical protein [endosymbiont GvMRE of Glomus versiforme]|uniref:hypothetical protein n=1 Tax=endosymbiont GvMRE of Glomus versiforme TaxID=2039283 RepID=UPI000EE8CD0F|nr:hypothetical protein [endosymbiont GvMRE of Glomus versiforme]RHZ35524.1 hypothetical protein GvMRE_IIg507 [endosymbiont GvMRE of Glomus versiforme]
MTQNAKFAKPNYREVQEKFLSEFDLSGHSELVKKDFYKKTLPRLWLFMFTVGLGGMVMSIFFTEPILEISFKHNLYNSSLPIH